MMNRKQKIIVSITGIILVSLILIGLTYAYFLTKITGNTNTKSISVTTANLVLEYGENTNVVQGISNAEPGYSVEKIFTATNKGNSTVTYGAALESIVNELSRQQDLVYTLTCTSYLKEGFSLASDGTITGTVDGTCNGVPTETKFPNTSDLSIMVNNTIDTTHTHAYKLTVTYKEMGIDQSADMNKTFSAKVNIVDLNAVARKNPYEDNKNSLAYNIINNAMNKTNGTELVGTPKTIPAKDASSFKYYTDKINEKTNEYSTSISTKYQGYYWTYGTGYTIDENTGKFTLTGVSTCKYNDGTCHETLVGKYLVESRAFGNSSSTDKQKTTTNLKNICKVTEAPASSTSTIIMKMKGISSISYSTEKELSISADDYGTSYYYRGGVEDNYVNFAGMCWKIVRIEGDGATKLILDDGDVECNNSLYTGNISPDLGPITDVDEEFAYLRHFQTSKLSEYYDKLKAGDWCYDNKVAITEVFGYDEMGNKITDKDKIVGDLYTYKYYGAYKRIEIDKTPSLICMGEKLNNYGINYESYVGRLTADEVSFAGATVNTKGLHYLMNGSDLFCTFSNSFSPDENTVFKYNLNSTGNLTYEAYSCPERYVVVLLPGTQISGGNGTISNPYIIQ